MELLTDVWSVIVAFITFTAGVLLCAAVSKALSVPLLRGLGIYLWHSIFCVLYVLFVLSEGGDSIPYYNIAASGDVVWEVGTSAIIIIAAPFITGLGFSFFGVNLLFNIFGAVGLLAFYASLRAELVNKPYWVRNFALFIVFLPSVSFWSSALGKDSLSFMSASLALWASLRLEKRLLLMAFAIFVMLVVRPHMAGIMLLALAASFLFGSGTNASLRFVLVLVALCFSVLLVPFALDYAGLGVDVGVEDVGDYVEKRQGYNMDGGGGIDIASMSLPMKMFTYLFRPVPFEAHSLVAFAASFDNVILISAVVLGAWGFLCGRGPHLPANRIFMCLYVLASLLVLSVVTANLGISVRQKWMFMPMLLFLAFSYMGKSRESNSYSPCNATALSSGRI